MADEEQKKKSGGSPLVAIALALLVAGGGGTYYFYSQYQQSQQELMAAREEVQQNQQELVAQIVGEVGQLMELPQDETPTVATIRNTDNLADHPFLSKGQEGDRLLIYTGAKLAVMYRPSINKIVAVGAVSIQQQDQVAGDQTEATGSANQEGQGVQQPASEEQQPAEEGQ